MRGTKCVREGKRGKMKRKRGVEEDDRKRKREGGIFILQHRGLGVCMFCNGPDGTELRAEMKSSLMAHQRTDRLE